MKRTPRTHAVLHRAGALLQRAWATVVSTCMLAQARAGGGQDYHSGGGGGSGGGISFPSSGGGLSDHGFGSGSGSLGAGGSSNLVFLVFILIVAYLIWKHILDRKQADRFQGTLDPGLQSGLRRTAPAGSPGALRLQKKLAEAFVNIQQAWDGGKMDPVRAILSDGVYHRFQIQLEMNRLQGTRNRVELPALLGSKLLNETAFGRYLSVDFLIRGRVVDRDIRISDAAVVSGGGATDFEEIWSFTRLADAPEADTLQTLANCPKCAAPLSEAGGSRCGHCGAILNSGAYDWVLAEITQAGEWSAGDRSHLQRFYAQLPALSGAPEGTDAKAWLSPQELEDRASVVFIRYQSALHKGNLGALAMFATPELLKSLGGTAAEKPQYRLAVGAVDLQGFAESQGLVKAWIRVRFSAAANRNEQGRFQERVLVFSKSIHAGGGKGDLSCMTCPGCGGPIGSSDQAKCAYCDNVLSSPAANWVLSGYGGMELLSQLPRTRATSSPMANPSSILSPEATGKTETNVQVRILSAIVLAALEDGAVSEAEEQTVREFARHFGLGTFFVGMLLAKAKQDPAALAERLEMPVALKWLNNLIMVAVADGKVSRDEEDLLISFARRHGIDEKQVRYALKAALKIQP